MAGEAIKIMTEKVVIDNKAIAEEEEEDTLIGITTTTMEKQEPSIEEEEDIEVVAEQIITKRLMTPKLSETREKNK